MQHFRNLTEYNMEGNSVVTLGKFDGFHRGHQSLIREILQISERERINSVVVSISKPLGDCILFGEEKVKMLESMGVDSFVECPFTPEFCHLTPQEFVETVLVRILKAKWIVVGSDFKFGYRRSGDVETLQNLAGKNGYQLKVIPKKQYLGEAISSTRIREAIEKGRIEEANRMLGYRYHCTGTVLHGRALGRTIGIPTVNLAPKPQKLIPPYGVYESITSVGEKSYNGITNIGKKPTVGGDTVGVETYLYDFSGDLYGKEITVSLLHFERPEQKFSSVEELKEQVGRDKENGIRFFEQWITEQDPEENEEVRK